MSDYLSEMSIVIGALFERAYKLLGEDHEVTEYLLELALNYRRKVSKGEDGFREGHAKFHNATAGRLDLYNMKAVRALTSGS